MFQTRIGQMEFIKKLLEYLLLNLKVLILWDVNKNFSANHYIRIVLIFFLSILTAFAKVLAPASLAKAIEMIALSQEDFKIGSVSLRPMQLLYGSVALTTWIKSEIYIKKLLVREFERLQIKNSSLKMIMATHQISFEQHQKNKPFFTQTLLEIINHQSKIAGEVLTTVLQSLLDLILGMVLIWRRYGRMLGGEFVAYLALDIFLISFFVDYLTKHSEKMIKSDKRLHRYMNHEYEIINFEETVRTFYHQGLETKLSENFLIKYLHSFRRQQLAEDIAAGLKVIPLIVANIIPITFLLKDKLTLDDLDDFIFLLSYINLFGGSITSLSQSMKNCLRGLQSIMRQRNFEVSQVEHDWRQGFNLTVIGPSLEFGSPLIEFKNVTFCYPQSSCPTLNNVTFTIKPGKKIGIIGKSNAGKSTIVKLLFGLYQHQQGDILLNGHDIKTISNSVLAKIFCCIPQTADLFSRKSLKYNVIYGSGDDNLIYNYVTNKKNKTENVPNYRTINSEPDDYHDNASSNLNQKFVDAMLKVNLDKLITPDADDDKKIIGLSGGQRQRISLARSLLRESSVCIFDEPSSSLDSFTEYEVLTRIKKITHDKTSIMITHRLATIMDVDDVLVIENGKIVEQGNPKELLQHEGNFAEYCHVQMGRR